MNYSIWLMFLSLAWSGPVGAATAPERTPPADAEARPVEKAIAVDVRSAPLADVLTQAAGATGSRMTVAGPAGDQRVTLHAAHTTASELRDVLRDLMRLRVSRQGSDTNERYTLS